MARKTLTLCDVRGRTDGQLQRKARGATCQDPPERDFWTGAYKNPSKVPKWKKGSHNKTKTTRAAYDRRRKLKARIEKKIDEKARELVDIDRKLAEREEVLELAGKAPTVKEMRAATAQLFKEMNLNPIKELIQLTKARGPNKLSPRDRAMILKELAQYQAPKPKSVDLQADANMSVTVGMMDFRNVGVGTVKQAEAATDEDYDEFEVVDE